MKVFYRESGVCLFQLFSRILLEKLRRIRKKNKTGFKKLNNLTD